MLLVAIVAIVFRQYWFASGDQNLYFVMANKIVDTSLYKNDDFFISDQQELTFFPYFLAALQICFKDIQIPTFILHFFSIFLNFYTIAKITMKIFNNRMIVYVTSSMMLFPTWFLTFDFVLVPLELAMPISMMGIYYFLENKNKQAMIIFGIAGLIHPLSIIFYVVAIFSYMLYHKKFKELLKSAFIFTAILSPLILNVLLKSNALRNTHAQDVEQLNLINQLYFLKFINPLIWGLSDWINVVSYCVPLVLILYYRNKRKFMNESDKKISFMFLITILIFVISVLIDKFYPTMFIFQLQSQRAFIFFRYIVLAYISWAIVKANQNKKSPLMIASSILVIIAFYITQYPLYIFAWILFYISYFYSIKLSFIHKKQEISVLIIATTILFSFTMIGTASLINTRKDLPYAVYFNSPETKAWIDSQFWAHDNTEKNATFLTPYDTFNNFRVYSQRNVVYGTWDDSLVIFSHEYAVKLLKKRADFSNYNQLNETRLLDLAIKYEANFIVIHSGKTLNLTLTYSNAYYEIYSI